MYQFSLVDYLYGPLAFVIIVLIARVIKYRRVAANPEYKYFTKGLYVKMLGGVALCLIYTLYYNGGDTVNYMDDGVCMMRLMFIDFSGFYQIMTKGLSLSNYYYFTDETGYPIYYKNKETFYVVRVIMPLVLIGAGSFIVTTLFVAMVSYIGIWRLYTVYIMEFPDLKKQMAIAFLFIPSVFFWGSGIMKDTITMSCIGYYTYAFYWIFIKGKYKFGHFIALFISTYLILAIKPYIIFALMPGSIIWFINTNIGKIRNVIIKYLSGPVLFIIAVIGGYVLLLSMGEILGAYSVDKVLDKAVVTNLDLKADYYAGNSFDIGEFDATIPSMLAKAPVAIAAAIYRPYIWEANNIVMLASGLESLFMLFITIRILLRLRIYGVFQMSIKHPLLTFSLIFSLFFAFSVGISTSNFGSLVRYRIPVLPFFIASLYMMEYYFRTKRNSIESSRIVPDKVILPAT